MKFAYLSFLCFCIAFSAYSQEKARYSIEFTDQKAEDALALIEDTYNVKFSYRSDLVKNKYINLEKADRTLDEVLFEISLIIHVTFQKIDEQYIYLVPDNTRVLDEVIIQNYLVDGVSKNINSSFEINPKALGLLPGLIEADILESVQQLPGVIGIDESATELSVRGGSADQNRIIWDGINIYQSSHLFGMLSVFNPNVPSRITFYNKGTNPRFGERVASVIDISTSTKIQDSIKAEAGFNSISADGFLDIPIVKKKLSLQGSFRRSFEDLIETNAFKNLEKKVFQGTPIEDELFSFRDYNIKLNYKPDRENSLYASIIHIDNDLESNFPESSFDTSYYNVLDAENTGYSLQWNYLWQDNINQQTQINLSRYNLRYNYQFRENNQLISDFFEKNSISDFGVASEVFVDLNSDNSYSLGYQYSLKNVDYITAGSSGITYQSTETNAIINTHSFFGNYTYRKSDLMDIQAGLRINYYTGLNSIRLEPRIIVNRKIIENLKIQLTGEIKNQIISQLQEDILSSGLLENRLWVLADNGQLPIVNSKQYSLGFIYAKNDWIFDLDVYHKNVSGITSAFTGFLNLTSSSFNTGDEIINGINIYMKKDIGPINTWASYSYIDANDRYQGINNNLRFSSSTEMKHNISASFGYTLKQFQFALGWQWRTGKPYTELEYDSSGNAIYFEGINNENFPVFHRLDFSTTYAFAFSKRRKTRGKIGLSIRNLYDRKNYIDIKYIGDISSPQEIKTVDIFSLGRTINIMFRVFF